jgi:hypothetical protein
MLLAVPTAGEMDASDDCGSIERYIFGKPADIPTYYAAK